MEKTKCPYCDRLFVTYSKDGNKWLNEALGKHYKEEHDNVPFIKNGTNPNLIGK